MIAQQSVDGDQRRPQSDTPDSREHDQAIPVRYHGVVAMTLRLTPEDERLLAALADAEGISRHEATLRAIREAAARRVHEAKVAELSARARERYADVLDRLGR